MPTNGGELPLDANSLLENNPMPEALPQFVDDVLAACKVGAEEAGASLARAFEGEMQVTLGPQSTLKSAAPQLDLQGKGLVVLLKTDRTTVGMTIPAAKGLVPAWCASPTRPARASWRPWPRNWA